MKNNTGVVCILLILSATCVGAAPDTGANESRVNFFIEPLLQKGLGGTAYDLSASAGGANSWLSRLEFPQYPLEAGITLGAVIEHEGRRQWLFEAGFSHSTLPIAGTMTDSDWVWTPPYPRMLFSYTESNDTTVSWRASVEAALTFASSDKASISLYAGYRYQSISHVESSVIGWDWDPTVNPTTINVIPYATGDIMEYALTAHEPGLGLMADIEPFPGLSFELRVSLTPVYVSDVDDHKLRTKLSTASGWGAGVYADLRGTYQFPRYFKNFSTYIALNGELIYYSVSTTQTQYWYGNADFLQGGAPQGTLYTGVGHVITSTQVQVGFRLGFKL